MASITRMFKAEYDAWRRIQAWCHDPTDPAWKWYGGTGISVCPEWRQSFQTFLIDVGPKPKRNRSIWLGRKDTSGNYEPENVAWVPRERQISHRRYCHRMIIDGQDLTIQEAGRAIGLPPMTLRSRVLRLKVSPEMSVTPGRLPFRKNSRFVTHNGETLAVPEWAKRLGVNLKTLRCRLRRKMPLDRALLAGKRNRWDKDSSR